MIHIIIGTKAQLIKMAPIMKKLEDNNIEYNYISTGQHKDDLDDIAKNFRIKNPDIYLYEKGDRTSTTTVFKWFIYIIFHGIKNRKTIFKNDKNGIVLVHGDTLSTLAGALLSKVNGTKVGHVESGLRSFNLLNPFPEEITRILTFKLTDIYFCPSKSAINNLRKEKGKKIFTEENTLYDSIHEYIKVKNNNTEKNQCLKFCLASIHRYENIKSYKSLVRVVEIIERISLKINVIMILHKPTKESLIKNNLYYRLKNNKNIKLRDRMDFFSFITILEKSEFLVSDGGSNQEECSYLGKPILIVRKATEREHGLSKNAIISFYDNDIIDTFLENYHQYNKELFKLDISPSEIVYKHCLNFI